MEALRKDVNGDNVNVNVSAQICTAHIGPPNALSVPVSCKQKCFSGRLIAAFVACGLRTGPGRLFQRDGPEMAKVRQPYAC